MKTKYKISKRKATPFGGLYIISEFIHQMKISDIFDKIFGEYRRIRKYKPWENVCLLIATILAGGERLYDIERFETDNVLPVLFGNGNVPKDTTIRDDMKHLGSMDNARREMLFQLNEMLFKQRKLKDIIIDVDGTCLPVDGHQEGADYGHCPADQDSRCFQSLSAVCDETQTVITEETRPGNTHCAKDVIQFVKRILDRFACQMTKITLRFDTGFFSYKLLKLLESYPNVVYEVGVPKDDTMAKRIRGLIYKSYHQSERQYSKLSTFDRRYYYVERTKKPPKRQLDLLDRDEYTYRVIISNDGNRQPHTIFREYNGRGRDELQIRELKNEYALGKMVSGDFEVTKALCWVSHLAYTLLGMFRQIALRRDLAKYRLRRLRFILFSTVAYWTKHARQRVLKLCNPLIGDTHFKFIMDRVWSC